MMKFNIEDNSLLEFKDGMILDKEEKLSFKSIYF